MTKQFLFICFFFLHFNISAQINDLLKDNNIVWVGEFTTDFVVEGYKQLDTSEYINTVKFFKYLNTESYSYRDIDKPLLAKIENTLYKKSLPFYHQHTLLNRIDPIPSMDTLQMIDPTTYEKKTRIVFNCGFTLPTPIYYRAAQILFYDKKKKNFGLRVLAICPVAHQRDETGTVIGLREIGWIKTNNEMRKINLNSANITFATRLTTRSNSPSFETDFKVLKNTVGNIQQIFINDLTNGTGIDLYSPADYNQKLSKEERNATFKAFKPSPLLAKITNDSNAVLTIKEEVLRRQKLKDEQDGFGDFMPLIKDSQNEKFSSSDSNSSVKNRQTYDKEDLSSFNYFGGSNSIDSVAFNGIKEMHKLKIVQDWYWDEKLNTISVHLFGVAPMIKMYDNDGHFSYNQNIFFRLNDTQ